MNWSYRTTLRQSNLSGNSPDNITLCLCKWWILKSIYFKIILEGFKYEKKDGCYFGCIYCAIKLCLKVECIECCKVENKQNLQ